MRKLIIFSCVVVLLSSCGVFNKYHRPDVNTSGLYRDTASITGYLNSTDTTTLASTPWREVFTDIYLQQLIDSGLKKNTDIRSAALSVSEVKEMLKVARLAFVPAFQLSGSGSISSFDFGSATKTYSLPIEAKWSVDIFGTPNVYRKAKITIEQTKDYERAVKTGLVAGIANCYYTLLMLDKQMEITKNTEQLTKQTYEMMVAQKQFAGADESAVQSAKANYYSVMASIPELERQIRETENALSVLLAEAPHTINRGTLEGQYLPEKFSVGIPVQLLANRPDVHAKEMALASCFYDVNKARAAFYPVLSISGSAGWSNNNGAVNPGKVLSSAVASLVQPIFQRGALSAQLRVAKAEEEIAYMAWQQSILNAGSEVSNALELYNTSNQRISLLKEQITSLERNVQVAQKMFKMSSNYNYLNIISAQQSLLSAQLSQITNQFHKMQAVVNLYSALGGGVN